MSATRNWTYPHFPDGRIEMRQWHGLLGICLAVHCLGQASPAADGSSSAAMRTPAPPPAAASSQPSHDELTARLMEMRADILDYEEPVIRAVRVGEPQWLSGTARVDVAAEPDWAELTLSFYATGSGRHRVALVPTSGLRRIGTLEAKPNSASVSVLGMEFFFYDTFNFSFHTSVDLLQAGSQANCARIAAKLKLPDSVRQAVLARLKEPTQFELWKRAVEMIAIDAKPNPQTVEDALYWAAMAETHTCFTGPNVCHVIEGNGVGVLLFCDDNMGECQDLDCMRISVLVFRAGKFSYMFVIDRRHSRQGERFLPWDERALRMVRSIVDSALANGEQD
jgi:hypothetical protein